MNRRSVRRCVVLVAFAAVGCGQPPHAGLSGSVTYRGQPVENGTLTLIPLDPAGFVRGAMVTAGRYEFDSPVGVPPGKYRVQIAAPDPVSVPADVNELPADLLPPKYNTESELTVELQNGRNRADFDLK